MTIAAIVVAHAIIARTEAEAPRAARVVSVERTRPVVAVAACVVEVATAAVASSGQEETIAIARNEKASVYAVPLCLRDSRVIK